MGGQGFFTSFVATLWDFYGGMFRLTLFLPFTLLQVEVILRNEVKYYFLLHILMLNVGMAAYKTEILE